MSWSVKKQLLSPGYSVPRRFAFKYKNFLQSGSNVHNQNCQFAEFAALIGHSALKIFLRLTDTVWVVWTVCSD